MLKLSRFAHAVANPQRRQHQHHAEEEGETPAPAQKLFVAGIGADERHQAGCEQQADAIANLDAAAVEGFFMLWRAFYGEQRRAAPFAAPFAAHGKALDRAQKHQQHRRPPADLIERGQQANAGGGDPHHPDGHHQHPLAPEAVAKMAENNAA